MTTTIRDSRTSCDEDQINRFFPLVDLTSDPLGFEAGDANLYRYVGNSPTNATDPSGLKTRAEWEQAAQNLIGFKPGSPTHPRDILEMNRRITAAYAEMYLRDPSKFVWAGMAAFASCDVGKGMSQARALRDEAGNPLIAIGAVLTGAPTGTELATALGKGNLGVYADIYWQHLAYAQGGIKEMRDLKDRGELLVEQLNAWELIEQGKVWEGNRQLLIYEQSVTLQKGVYDQHSKAFKNMSWLADYAPWMLKSPIPGHDVAFTECVPGGNLGAFDDRWKWIDTSMLPSWKKLAQENPARVREMMDEFLKGKFTK
jgi:hypothetical protein